MMASVDFNQHSTKKIRGFIQGSMHLPPSVFKRVENVGCNIKILMFLAFGPKDAIEIIYGYPDSKNKDHFDAETVESTWLIPGKTVEISPCMSYLVENHSSKCEALLKWIFVRNEF